MRLSSIMAIAIASLFLAAFAVPAQAKSAKVQISSEQTYDFSARRKRVVHRKVKRIRTDRVPTMASTSCLSDNNGRTICLGAADSYQYAQPERTIVMHGTLTITKRIHKRTEAKRGGLIADIKSRLVTVATAAGIKITVHPAFAAQFQAFIADLVSQGHKPRFITCYARGHVSGSNHHWGGACDVDQTGWNRTSAFMYHAGNTIRANGLYDGCSFRDCGHVEAMRGTHNNPPNVYASVEKFKQQNIGAMP